MADKNEQWKNAQDPTPLTKERVAEKRLEATINEASAGLPVGWVYEYLPMDSATPPHWKKEMKTNDGVEWVILDKKKKPVLLVVATGILKEGKKWLHLSISRRNGMPSWEELKEIKGYVVGTDKHAYMVLSPEKETDSNAKLFHLYACLDSENEDGRVLPDFTNGLPWI